MTHVLLRCPARGGGGPAPVPATIPAVSPSFPFLRPVAEMCAIDGSCSACGWMSVAVDVVPLVPRCLKRADESGQRAGHPQWELVAMVRAARVAARTERHDPPTAVQAGEVPHVASHRAADSDVGAECPGAPDTVVVAGEP